MKTNHVQQKTTSLFDEVKDLAKQTKDIARLDLFKSHPLGTLIFEIPEAVGYAIKFAVVRILKGKRIDEFKKDEDNNYYRNSWKNWLIGVSAISVGTLPVTAPVAYKAGRALNNMANEASRPKVYVLTQSEQEILNTQFEQLKHDPQLRRALEQRLQQDDLQRIRAR